MAYRDPYPEALGWAIGTMMSAATSLEHGTKTPQEVAEYLREAVEELRGPRQLVERLDKERVPAATGTK